MREVTYKKRPAIAGRFYVRRLGVVWDEWHEGRPRRGSSEVGRGRRPKAGAAAIHHACVRVHHRSKARNVLEVDVILRILLLFLVHG